MAQKPPREITQSPPEAANSVPFSIQCHQLRTHRRALCAGGHSEGRGSGGDGSTAYPTLSLKPRELQPIPLFSSFNNPHHEITFCLALGQKGLAREHPSIPSKLSCRAGVAQDAQIALVAQLPRIETEQPQQHPCSDRSRRDQCCCWECS